MGHVSNFNGINGYEECDMSQASSDLLSANILEFNLDDLPFSDDAFQQDERNGFFDQPLFDMLPDSDHQFSNDFDVHNSLHAEKTPTLETDPSNLSESARTEETKLSSSENCVDKDLESDESDKYSSPEIKTYTAETVFENSQSSEKKLQVPKIVIKLKPESIVTEQESKAIQPKLIESKSFADELSLVDYYYTIADKVKMGRRRRTVNLKTDDILKKNSDGHHKRKSQHKIETKSKKRKHSNKILKNDISEAFKMNEQNYPKFHLHNYSLAKNIHQHSTEVSYSNVESEKQGFESDNGELEYDSLSSPDNTEPDFNAEREYAGLSAFNSFDFGVGDEAIISESSSVDNNKELSGSVHDILEDLEISLPDGVNVPELDKIFLDDAPPVSGINCSKENSAQKSIRSPEINEKDKITDSKPLVTELIDELHAHNQQVFEEIEVSTPDLELKLPDTKHSIQEVCVKTSQNTTGCANGVVKQCGTGGHQENDDFHRQLPLDKTSPKLLTSMEINENTIRSRKTSNSSCSFTSKSTSHRTYRKRRSRMLSSSSSSSSDTEKFYNRPVKYDPVTETYLDEFGRVVRPSELKQYLKPKSNHRESYSTNRSSSSRSRSPHSKSHQRKYHRHSRSHRKRHHSSSRSRSRSSDHNWKDSIRKYSSKHLSRKPHYMDLEENIKANEERRVMYVGDIPPGFTVEQLKERFSIFGPIQDATIKSKTTSDNSLYIFGFVTFKNNMDACNAIENGNSDPRWPRFDLNFGGRRRFCNGNYTDLDGKVAEYESGWYSRTLSFHPQPLHEEEDDFAKLLRLEQKRLGMTKK